MHNSSMHRPEIALIRLVAQREFPALSASKYKPAFHSRSLAQTSDCGTISPLFPLNQVRQVLTLSRKGDRVMKNTRLTSSSVPVLTTCAYHRVPRVDPIRF